MVVIGDEILGGYVADSNSGWFAQRLRAHGVPLTRVQVVPDEFAAIDEALRAELARTAPRLIVTSGGIGSTPDDITYEAVAATLGRELVEDPTISERIDAALAWTAEQGIDVTDEFAWHLKRMSRIPAGSRLLSAVAGWSPGVTVDLDGGCDRGGTTVVVLPGVPGQFRGLVEHAVEPQLLAGRRDVPSVAEVPHHFPESALNLTFAALLDRFEVKLGSYPGDPMLVRLTGTSDQVAAAERFVRDAVERLAASPAGQRLQAAWTARLHREDDPDGQDPDPGPHQEDRA